MSRPRSAAGTSPACPPALDGKLPPARHIEVKGRAKGQTTVTVTRNEILYGLNQADKFILAIVLVDGEQHEGPFYVRQPFTQEPDWAVTSINLDLDQLLARASHRKTRCEQRSSVQAESRSGLIATSAATKPSTMSSVKLHRDSS